MPTECEICGAPYIVKVNRGFRAFKLTLTEHIDHALKVLATHEERRRREQVRRRRERKLGVYVMAIPRKLINHLRQMTSH